MSTERHLRRPRNDDRVSSPACKTQRVRFSEKHNQALFSDKVKSSELGSWLRNKILGFGLGFSHLDSHHLCHHIVYNLPQLLRTVNRFVFFLFLYVEDAPEEESSCSGPAERGATEKSYWLNAGFCFQSILGTEQKAAKTR